MRQESLNLSHDEKQALDREETRLSRQAKHRITLGKLIDNWQRFVGEVEAGYRLTIYDYENDLSIRSLIEEIMIAIPSMRDRMQRIIRESDDKFRETTIESNLVWGGGVDIVWLKRIPKKLVGELADDIRDRLAEKS